MEGLRSQPDLHDLLQIEDDSLSLLDRTKDSTSPVRTVQNPLTNAGKLTTPAKVLMVGEPVMVKTEQAEDGAEDGDTTTSAAEISGSSNEELADGINSPSPETAAAMESLMAVDDLTSASPKLDEVPKLPVPVNFTSSNSSKVAVRPQTSIMASIRTSQPSSIAGRKFTVATQPLQVIKKDGGGPVMTKFIVKRTNTAAAASHKSPVVFTKGNRSTLTSSPVKSVNLQSGSIVLSPIKGGFKIPISPLKSPLKVSVIPPSNSKKLNLSTDKSFTIPINTSVPQLQLRTQTAVSSGNVTLANGLPTKAVKTVVSQQPQHVFVQNRLVNTSASQQQVGNQTNQLLQQISMVPSQPAVQDPSGVKIQYVQLLSPNSGQPQVLRSNQGQPITFTSMAQLNGSGIALNQPSGPITLIQPGGVKFQPQASPGVQTQRKAHAVKVAIPQQPTIQPTQQQLKPQQRLIMPASAANLQPIRPNISVLPGGYAMVPAKYVEQLAKRFGNQQSFTQETSLQSMQKTIPSKIGSNGKLKKPCNCTKSQCLKLYCECFANGQFCDDCNCINCSNNLEHEVERSKAIKQCLERNPQAFRPKIGRGKDDNRTHQKGCNCKRSGCLKNYCECYEARIPCTSKCKCIGCKNYEESSDRRSLMSLADAAEVRVQQQTAAKSKLSSQIGEMRPNPRMTSSGERLPYTFFTQEVIEATCTCLLAQAEEAEKTNRPMVVAEAMILEEFGRCVMQIIQSAGKAKVPQLH